MLNSRLGGSTRALDPRPDASLCVMALLFLLVAELSKSSQGGARWPLIVTNVVQACLADVYARMA